MADQSLEHLAEYRKIRNILREKNTLSDNIILCYIGHSMLGTGMNWDQKSPNENLSRKVNPESFLFSSENPNMREYLVNTGCLIGKSGRFTNFVRSSLTSVCSREIKKLF